MTAQVPVKIALTYFLPFAVLTYSALVIACLIHREASRGCCRLGRNA